MSAALAGVLEDQLIGLRAYDVVSVAFRATGSDEVRIFDGVRVIMSSLTEIGLLTNFWL